MELYNLHTINNKYNNNKVINKYYLNDFAFNIGKVNNKLIPTQEILSLKYSAVSFNLYTAMLFLDSYYSNSKTKFSNLVFLQTSNFYLQAAYDNLFQLLYFMTFDDNKNDKLLNNNDHRYKVEESFKFYNLKTNPQNKNIIKMVNKFYKNILKDVRYYNNYVKHNGQLDYYKTNETSIYQVPFDNNNIEQSIYAGMYNASNNINPITAKTPKSKHIDIDVLSNNIFKSIDELCYILSVTMTIYTDDIYKELCKLSRSLAMGK